MAVDDMSFFDKVKNKLVNIQNLLSNKHWQALIAVMMCIFVILAYYMYKTYYLPIKNKTYVENKEYLKGEYHEGLELMYFYTDWCPHCKKARPIWDTFKQDPIFEGGKYKGTSVIFVEINCDENPKIADEYKITGYPTIKLIKGNKVIEYDAQPDITTLKQFVKTSV
tara:strand:+ start:106 stop:606 length:501 start_codon:yes stop_codon:yes gene_type:complete